MLAKYDGKPVPSRRLLAASVCNCVALYLFGQRYDLDDPRRRSMDRQVEAFFRAGASTPVEFLPTWVKRLAMLLMPDCRSNFVERFAKQVTKFSRDQVVISQKTQDGSRHRSFIDIYLRETQKQASCVDSSITMSCLVGNVTDLLLGGTAASTLFLHWQLLNVAARPDTLQVALQHEIDTVVGRGRWPAWNDRTRMPLVMATIWETFRWKAATPLGKRSCPGEALATVEMFLYTTHLLHAFRILPVEEGLLERVESLSARSNDLASVRLRFLRR
ncbi:hypothetical protein MTO96_028289 [Rhipicephalus appendiculatus]